MQHNLSKFIFLLLCIILGACSSKLKTPVLRDGAERLNAIKMTVPGTIGLATNIIWPGNEEYDEYKNAKEFIKKYCVLGDEKIKITIGQSILFAEINSGVAWINANLKNTLYEYNKEKKTNYNLLVWDRIDKIEGTRIFLIIASIYENCDLKSHSEVIDREVYVFSKSIVERKDENNGVYLEHYFKLNRNINKNYNVPFPKGNWSEDISIPVKVYKRISKGQTNKEYRYEYFLRLYNISRDKGVLKTVSNSFPNKKFCYQIDGFSECNNIDVHVRVWPDSLAGYVDANKLNNSFLLLNKERKDYFEESLFLDLTNKNIKLIDENGTSLVEYTFNPIEVQAFLYKVKKLQGISYNFSKPLIKKKPDLIKKKPDLIKKKPDLIKKKLDLIKKQPKEDKKIAKVSDKSSKKTSNIKLLGGNQLFTIHYVHNSGLGIAYNSFNPAIEYGIGTVPIYVLPFQDIFSISYNLNYDKLSFDFGLGAFSGGGEVHGCANYQTCYGDEPDIEINDGKLIQLFSSYEILNYLDITLGINWIMLTIEDKKVSDSDYRLDPREESIIYPSLGFSIVF
jgi:hypothetical protein